MSQESTLMTDILYGIMGIYFLYKPLTNINAQVSSQIHKLTMKYLSLHNRNNCHFLFHRSN